MQNLISKIISNKNLDFIDTEKNNHYTLPDIITSNSSILNQPKSLAFLYLDNTIKSIATLFFFLKSHHITALLSDRLNPEFKKQLETLYQPVYIFDKNRKIIEQFVTSEVNDFINIHACKKPYFYPLSPDLKMLLSTSGTTGSPKFVKLSERNLIENALSIIDYLPLRSDDVVPLNLPIYYSYGLSILNTNSIAGGTIVCTNGDVIDKKFWTDFNTYKCTSIAGVPYVYEMLNRIGFTKNKYPHLRYMTQAGGKLNKNLINHFAEYAANNNVLFFVMYGQTEATARIAYLPPTFLKSKTESIGRPIKGGEFLIDNETHELLYKGPNVFGGYAENIDDLSTYEQPSYLCTGDVAKMDEDGFYYITGRLKRFIKIVGSRINLDEIENLLKLAFPNTTFVCLGVNDKILYVIFNSSTTNDNIIKQFIYQKLEIHPNFVKTMFMDSIPLTVNGKIDYSTLQNSIQNNT